MNMHIDGPTLPLPGLRPRDPDEVLDDELVGGCTLELVVPGKPYGARRPNVVRRGDRHFAVNPDSHVEHEERIRIAAEAAQGGPLGAWVTIEGPVRVQIETWHHRPARLKRAADRGAYLRTGSSTAYTGKPDADNVAKLVMDALTRAGTWRDDTQVSDLSVRRRYLDLGLDGVEIGIERTEVRVYAS